MNRRYFDIWGLRDLCLLFLMMFSICFCEKENPGNLMPSIIVNEAYEITRNSAVVSGEITPNGKGVISRVLFRYGKDETCRDSVIIISPLNLKPVVRLEGLMAGTRYHYRFEAGNNYTLVESSTSNFTTQPNRVPELGVTETIYTGLLSAIFYTPISDDGGAPVEESGLYLWEMLSEGNLAEGADKAAKISSLENKDGGFYTKITKLKPNTGYCVKPYSKNSEGESSGAILSFVTGEPSVVVETPGALSHIIDESEVSGIESLSIAGNLNGSDFAFLRAVLGGNPNHNSLYVDSLKGSLRFLDLTETNIVEGGSTYDGYRYTLNNEISTGLFEGCVNLEEISLPATAVVMKVDAFKGCSGLKRLVITDGLESISPSAGCHNLESICVVDTNPLYRSHNGVLYNKGLSELVWWPLAKSATGYEWPEQIRRVAERACSGFMEPAIMLPSSLVEIGAYAFSGSLLVTIELPEKITVLETGTFQNSLSLKSMKLGSQFGYFSSYSVGNCPLELLYIKADTFLPYVASPAFEGTDIAKCTLYVKKGCSSLYKSSPFWSKFYSILEFE